MHCSGVTSDNGPAVTSRNCVLDPRKNETDVTSKEIFGNISLSDVCLDALSTAPIYIQPQTSVYHPDVLAVQNVMGQTQTQARSHKTTTGFRTRSIRDASYDRIIDNESIKLCNTCVVKPYDFVCIMDTDEEFQTLAARTILFHGYKDRLTVNLAFHYIRFLAHNCIVNNV